MIQVLVSCPYCVDGLFEYECEHESAGDGSQHETKCPDCGSFVIFNIGYDPVAQDER